MNKILTINLGGYPYTIDDDAYEILSRYLDRLRRHFRANQSYTEIIGDIENRLAEIFSEKLGTRTIIATKDVEDAISIMGTPEEFGAEASEGQSATGGSNTAYERLRQDYRTGKRLFRDPDDKVFGGVCSGIAAYFGVQDALWVRVGFAIAFFSFGVGFLLYFLLWIIVPEASSSADRLAMRGEPINVENIAKVVEEEVNSLSNRFNNYGSGQNTRPYSSNTGAKGAVGNFFSFIGEIFYGIVSVLKLIIKPFIFFFGVIAFIVLAALWIAFGVGVKEGYPFAHYAFGDSSFAGNLAFFNMFFLIGLALLGVGVLIARLFFKIKIDRFWTLILGAFWTLNGISLGILGAHFGSEFHREARVTQEIFNVSLPSDTLTIEVDKDNRFSDIHTRFGPFKFDSDKLLNGTVDLDIEQSNNNEFRLTKEMRSNGSSREEAEMLANQIDFQPKLDGNVLTIREFFNMTNTKYRGQSVKLTLYVPNGKYINLGKYTNDIINFDYDNDDYSYSDREGRVWKMQDREMICPSIEQEKNYSKNISVKDFSKVSMKANVSIEIKYGAAFDVKIKGDERDVKDFEVEKIGNTLKISDKDDNNNDNDKVKIIVTMPKLDAVDIEDAREVSIEGFDQNEMTMDLSGDFKLKASINVQKIKLDATHSQVVLKGKGSELEVILDSDAELNARQFEVRNANVSLHEGTEADIYATEKVVNRREEGSLKVEGGANVDRKKNDK